MSSRYDESSMSSLSAAQSAYNAAEPKPMSSNASRQSSRPPPRSQPRSVDGRSAQSVASALSHGSAGRASRHQEDERSTGNTVSLIGQVQDITDGYSRSSKSRDPSVRSPPPPRSVNSNTRRYDPDGMSHEYGADDPDGLHYAPGIRNHTQPNSTRGPPSVMSRSHPASVASSRNSRSYYEEEESQYSESMASSRGSTMRSEGGRGLSAEASRFSEREEEEESYYSKGSRGGRSSFTSKKVRFGG